MTPEERKAFEWFLEQGFSEEEIDFKSTRNIDFYVAGKPYEVKKVRKGCIYFSKAQYRVYNEINPIILVFSENGELVDVLPFKELCEKYKICIMTFNSIWFAKEIKKNNKRNSYHWRKHRRNENSRCIAYKRNFRKTEGVDER